MRAATTTQAVELAPESVPWGEPDFRLKPEAAQLAWKQALGRFLPRLVWAVAVLIPVAGAVAGVGVTLAASAPPQEAGAIALVYLIVIAPYAAVARAVD